MPTTVIPLHAILEAFQDLPYEHISRGNFCSSAQHEIAECAIQRNTLMVEEEYNHKLIRTWESGQFEQVNLTEFGKEKFISA